MTIFQPADAWLNRLVPCQRRSAQNLGLSYLASLCAVLLWVLLSSSAAAADKAPKPKAVLIGTLSADNKGVAADLYPALVLALKNGLEQGYGVTHPELHVDSYDSLIQRASMKSKVDAHGYFETGTMQTVLKNKGLPLARYVGLQLLKRDKGFALQISIFEPSNGELVAVREKLVTTEEGEDELLQLVTEAGCRIGHEADDDPALRRSGPQLPMKPRQAGQGHADEDPVLQLNRDENSLLVLGKDLVLDASASQDPDFDKVTWNWRQILPVSSEYALLSPGGSVRSSLRLHPTRAGVYKFCVAISDKLPARASYEEKQCEGPGKRLLTIEVGMPPIPPKDTYDLATKAPYKLHLNGNCPDKATCTYTQIGGPRVHIPSDQPSPSVELKSAGLYEFQHRIHNNFGDAIQTITQLLAPPPVAIIDAPDRIFDTNYGALDATGSYDSLGQPLSYLWTLSAYNPGYEAKIKAGKCELLGQASGSPFAYVTNPTEAHTALRTGKPGKYTLALRVVAQRTFDERATPGTGCAVKTVEVVPRRFEFYLGSRGKFGGPQSETIQLGVLVGGSVAIGSNFRFLAQQVAFKNAGNTDDGLSIKSFGGTHFDLSYEFSLCEGYFLRPMIGAATRAASGSTAGAGPRVEVDFGYHISRPFVIIAGPAFDDEYASEDKDWHPSFEASVSLGVVL